MDVRRSANFAGFDHHPGCRYVKTMLNHHVAALNRHLLAAQVPLLARTTWDRTSAEADLAAIRLESTWWPG